MSFINKVSQTMPGFGSPSYYGSVVNDSATGSAQAVIIANTSTTPATGGTPFNTTGGPAPSGGKARIKSNGVTGTFTLTSIVLTDSGTGTVQIAGPIAATTAGNFDYEFDFWTDIGITKVTFNYTVSSAVGTVDMEVSLV